MPSGLSVAPGRAAPAPVRATRPTVLVVHNHYTRPGGEDGVFEAECRLLRSRGHEVVAYEEDNRRIGRMSGPAVMAATVWSRHASRRLAALVAARSPRVAHFHNTFPLVSPAAYRACKRRGVAVVQTLHNYRLVCPGTLLSRRGEACERCVGRCLAWPAVVHGCYHGSRLESAAVASMVAIHAALGTWRHAVDVWVALSETAKETFVRGGIPRRKIVVKPNFVDPDPGPGAGRGGYALFVGRLAEEKGVATLVAAWRRLGGKIPLKIVGDGPLEPEVERLAASERHVEWLGWRAKPEVLELMKDAAVLVVPSLTPEGFPLVVAEAFATGLPVVTSDLGSLREIVRHGVTGCTFEPGDGERLAATVADVLSAGARLAEMRRAARAEYLARYTAERNYERLREIYALASGRLP